jgi:hypothetical protein
MDFGVRFAGALVSALTDDNALVGDDARADDRIRRGPAKPPLGERQRPPHPGAIVARLYHFSWKRAST